MECGAPDVEAAIGGAVEQQCATTVDQHACRSQDQHAPSRHLGRIADPSVGLDAHPCGDGQEHHGIEQRSHHLGPSEAERVVVAGGPGGHDLGDHCDEQGDDVGALVSGVGEKGQG